MSLTKLVHEQLPLNRKERFFTGTVLPMVICKDNFRHFRRFLSLIPGLESTVIKADPEEANVQFFTEYSLNESVGEEAQDRFPDVPSTKETLDVLILIKGEPKNLVALEAKMFDTPTTYELNRQMQNQQKMLKCIQESLGVQKVYHYALLPGELSRRLGQIDFPILTWEAIRAAYRPVCAGDYFLAMLELALHSYPRLAAKKRQYRHYCEQMIQGREIYERFKAGTLDKVSMGRGGGMNGERLGEDIRTGGWRDHSYETSSAEPPNSNWLYIANFVKLVDQASTCASTDTTPPVGQTGLRLPMNSGQSQHSNQPERQRKGGAPSQAGQSTLDAP